NTVAAGPLTGATLTFIVDQDGPERSVVTALLRAELRGLQAIAAPAVRANARRGLVRALAEDKADLESGGYASTDAR
ncbi:MAG: hypothetical protein OEV40_24145, partial [Acidimicrobiia bacterium]|nr:hypothetical protein [Acidimicrobiia bacterium]